jgi:hypothetical protein
MARPAAALAGMLTRRHTGSVGLDSHRVTAAFTAIVSLAFAGLAIAYTAFAFDASNRNGAPITLFFALAICGVPALVTGRFAYALWKSRPGA